jgi:hypothetical protein
MGTRVMQATVDGNVPAVRAYAHCLRPGTAGADADASGIALLLLNVHPTATVSVTLAGLTNGDAPARILRLTSDALSSRSAFLNGVALQTSADGTPPESPIGDGANERRDAADAATTASHPVTLSPLSATFVVVPSAGATACR